MRVQVLTNTEHFDFVISSVKKYKSEHDIRVSTQPYVILDKYDVGVSFMHQYRVLPEHVNTHTWINFHPAPLPEYKGRNLCYHAIMNGEKEFGATIHYMDENFDTGDIISVRKFKIRESWDAEDVYENAIDCSKMMFIDYFPRILMGEKFERRSNVGGNYYPKYPIDDYLFLSDQDELKKQIRAITYKNFYPKLDVNGVTYKIVKDE